MTTLELVRFVRECYPEYSGQLMMNLDDTAKLFGMSPADMRKHIRQNGIPHYRPVQRKLYILPEVLESIQKTRNS